MRRYAIQVLLGCILLAATVTAQEDSVCLRCHSEAAAAEHPAAQVVDPATIEGSVHAGVECSQCHHADPEVSHKGDRLVYCGRCHAEEAESYNKSPHVEGRTVNIDNLPTCVTCHGGHDILPIDHVEAPTNHINSVSLCTQCHEEEEVTKQAKQVPAPQMIKSYKGSVHGRELLVEGNMNAPACVDCHGSHSFLPSDDPDSPLYKTKIDETCGRCHADIASTYDESIHGEALHAGVLESPTCVNCHGEHNIRRHEDPDSPVYPTHVSQTCADCHASEKIVAKFGLKADRIETFEESFHGIATEFDDPRAANCASCHGVHNIFPQDDPRSMINAANIEQTCGSCHKGLPASFARSTVHVSAEQEGTGPWYVRQFYWLFIPLLIVIFLVYRILEYRKRVKRVE